MGEITSPHGIKGHVKVRSFTEDPETIKTFDFFLGPKGQKISLAFNREIGPGFYLCSIEDVKDRTQAEKYTGISLSVPKDQLPSLEEDEFYFDDLEGCRVISEGQELGVVLAVHDCGAGLFFDIKLTTDQKIATLPFNQDAVLSIDTLGKSIVIQKDFLLI